MRTTILMLVLSILFAAVCAQGQGSCGVAGRVIVPGFTSDRYIEVLQIYGARLAAFAYADSTGMFKLPALPTGSYDIVVRLDGFKEHKERVDCALAHDYTVYLEPEEAEIRPLILDFTGEVNEVVDVAELKRRIPKGIVEEFERARADRIRGQSDRARRRLEKLLMADPDFYDVHNVLGSVYLEMKLFREAEKEYNKARVLKPKSAAPLVSLGSLYLQEADAVLRPEPGVAGIAADIGVIFDDARAVLEEALRIKPDASFAHYLLGIVYIRTANYPKAEESLRRALDVESRLRWASIALVNLYMKQNRWQEALAELDAHLMEFPKFSNRSELLAARNEILEILVSRN